MNRPLHRGQACHLSVVARSLALLVITGPAALAAPVQTVVAPTPLPVYGETTPETPSNTLNVPFDFTFTQDFPVRRLRFSARLLCSASLAETRATDVVVLVTPPGGTPFGIVLLPDSNFGPGTPLATSRSVELPGGPYSSTGTWSARLVDAFAQDETLASVECTVTDLRITGDDGVLTPPASTDLGALTGPRTINGVLGELETKWYRFTTPRIDAMNGDYLDFTLGASVLDGLTMVLCDDQGVPIDTDGFSAPGLRGLLSFGVGSGTGPLNIGRADLAAGTYYLGILRQPVMDTIIGLVEFNPFDVFSYLVQPGGAFRLDVSRGNRALTTPTTSATIAIGNSTNTTRSFNLTQNGLRWYRVDISTTPIAPESGRFLDILTSESSLEDPALLLYDVEGTLQDRDDGTGFPGEPRFSRAWLSYGFGSGLRRGSRLVFDLQGGAIFAPELSRGQDGSLLPGSYYLAVASSSSVRAQARQFRVSGGDPDEPSNAGGVTRRFTSGTRSATPPTVPASQALGLLSGVRSLTSAISGAQVRWFSFDLSAAVTEESGRYLEIETGATAVDPSLTLFDGQGNLRARDEDGGLESNANLSFGIGESATRGDEPERAGRHGALGAGRYYLALAPDNSDAGRGFAFAAGDNASTENVSLRIATGTRSAPAPTPTVDLGSVTGRTVLTNIDAQSSPQWTRLVLDSPVTSGNGRYLLLRSVSSTGVENAPSAQLFDSSGAMRGALRPINNTTQQVIFGAGPSSDPDGPAVLIWPHAGDLPSGEYFLGSTSPGVVWSTLFETASPPPGLGDPAPLTVIEGLRAPVSPPPSTVNLGVAGAGTTSGQAVIGTPGFARFFRFEITQEASASTGRYVDIDASGSNGDGAFFNESAIALYRSSGQLLAHEQVLPFIDGGGGGGQSRGLSFGAPSPLRELPGGGDNDVARGQNGPLPAGSYIVGVAPLGVFFFDAFTGSKFPGLLEDAEATMRVNIRTNIPSVVACGPSDVAGAGQVVGADGELTADDIIVFIGWFFASDARADVAGAGQTVGADGQFTADDIILFINRFFAGC